MEGSAWRLRRGFAGFLWPPWGETDHCGPIAIQGACLRLPFRPVEVQLQPEAREVYETLSLAGGQPAHLYATANAASLVWADGDLLQTLIVPGDRAPTLVPIAESLMRK